MAFAAASAVFPPPTSKAVTAVVILITLFVAAAYIIVASICYRRIRQPPWAKSRFSELGRQRYVLVFHGLLLLFAVFEISLDSWLLAQYRHVGRFANVGSRDGIRLALFCSCWTFTTSTALLVLSFKPSLYLHVLAALNSQSICIALTWAMWIATTATLNRALPLVSPARRCAGADFCTQLRFAFGSALAELIVCTAGMLAVTWLSWKRFFSSSDGGHNPKAAVAPKAIPHISYNKR